MKETKHRRRHWKSVRILLAVLALFLTGAVSRATSFNLEGQNKDDTNNWYGGNLQDWQELDYIPCRVRITGDPVSNQLFTITFPHLTETTAGFENL